MRPLPVVIGFVVVYPAVDGAADRPYRAADGGPYSRDDRPYPRADETTGQSAFPRGLQ